MVYDCELMVNSWFMIVNWWFIDDFNLDLNTSACNSVCLDKCTSMIQLDPSCSHLSASFPLAQLPAFHTLAYPKPRLGITLAGVDIDPCAKMAWNGGHWWAVTRLKWPASFHWRRNHGIVMGCDGTVGGKENTMKTFVCFVMFRVSYGILVSWGLPCRVPMSSSRWSLDINDTTKASCCWSIASNIERASARVAQPGCNPGFRWE